MNIALFGYGKMGKMLEKLGLTRGHSFPIKVDISTNKPNVSINAIGVAIAISTAYAAVESLATYAKRVKELLFMPLILVLV